jgi:hypothetical protein
MADGQVDLREYALDFSAFRLRRFVGQCVRAGAGSVRLGDCATPST